MRYFFDNEGIFLRAVARNTGREGCVGVFFYGLSPAIRDGGVSWECFFYGLSPAIRDGAVVAGCFLRAVARNTGRRGLCGCFLWAVACSRGWEGGVPVVVADVAGEVVEEEALGAGDAALVVVVGPWGDEEETALGTGVELAAAGLL